MSEEAGYSIKERRTTNTHTHTYTYIYLYTYTHKEQEELWTDLSMTTISYYSAVFALQK